MLITSRWYQRNVINTFPEDFMQRLVDSSIDGIIVLGTDRTVQFLNKAATNLLGFTPQDAQCLHPTNLWLPLSAITHYESDMIAIESGRLVEPYEAVWLHKDGTPIEVSVVISAIRDNVGKLIGASQIIRDHHNERSAQRQLWDLRVKLVQTACMRKAERLMQVLAHELNHPLAIINLLAEALENEPAVSKKAGQISNQINRAVAIIKRARDDYRPECTPTDLNDLVEECVNLVAMAIGNAGINTTLTLDRNLFTAHVDSGQIAQVLVNLVRNAFEAMHKQPSGKLAISTKQTAEGVFITIADNGPGISPAIDDRLFEPYTTTKPNGLGIGLAISQDIVRAHGGELSIEERNHGACFVVKLPLG